MSDRVLESGEEVISVSELNGRVKNILGRSPSINRIWISGEISNLNNHRSGHCYFSLKDGGSRIDCTLFVNVLRRLKVRPEESMRILAFGSVDLWVPGGRYQFNIQDLRPDGIGELFIAFERLKKKLEGEGLFDRSAKRTLPRFPCRIGVVTSPTGAAVRDILQVTGRRYPSDILLFSAMVQGAGAGESIVKGIRMLDGEVDVIIVGRGGGSIEDLWGFNEEIVARAIFDCQTPIISAVGHETDFTIADFVADRRTTTPSASCSRCAATTSAC
jgi:exodeoxyribonuclease VII large subunit